MTTIHLGDCMDFMREQKDDTYDIIIADPPYETTNLKFDRDGVEWPKLSREMLRVLKPNGWLFLFGNTVMASQFLPDWRYKFEYVWIKGSPTICGARRPWFKHEIITAFVNPGITRINDLYFDQKAISVEGRRWRTRGGAPRKNNEFGTAHGHSSKKASSDTTLAHPMTVLYAPNKGTMRAAERTQHPTQKPVSIYETILLGYCPPGGLAFDPFGGSGTMAIAAMNAGRRYHLTEINPDYHAAIEERIAAHKPRLETARKQQTMTAHIEDDAP